MGSKKNQFFFGSAVLSHSAVIRHSVTGLLQIVKLRSFEAAGPSSHHLLGLGAVGCLPPPPRGHCWIVWTANAIW